MGDREEILILKLKVIVKISQKFKNPKNNCFKHLGWTTLVLELSKVFKKFIKFLEVSINIQQHLFSNLKQIKTTWKVIKITIKYCKPTNLFTFV